MLWRDRASGQRDQRTPKARPLTTMWLVGRRGRSFPGSLFKPHYKARWRPQMMNIWAMKGMTVANHEIPTTARSAAASWRRSNFPSWMSNGRCIRRPLLADKLVQMHRPITRRRKNRPDRLNHRMIHLHWHPANNGRVSDSVRRARVRSTFDRAGSEQDIVLSHSGYRWEQNGCGKHHGCRCDRCGQQQHTLLSNTQRTRPKGVPHDGLRKRDRASLCYGKFLRRA